MTDTQAAGPVVQELRDGILVLRIDARPENTLGHKLRLALRDAVAAAQENDAVAAMILIARGRTFPAGPDIAEFGKPQQAPTLSELNLAVEASTKPVAAALHGRVFGGGLELAISAHVRVAAASAQLALPEVGLGILPGAGGTQRLPRLIGAEQALRLILTGHQIGAAEALALGLLDEVVEDGLEAAAEARVRALTGTVLRPTKDRDAGKRDAAGYMTNLARARAAVGHSSLPGQRRIVDCVEAAYLLPFEQGLAFEQAAFDDLVNAPEAIALRHMFFAERRAARMPGARARPGPVSQIAVIGAGADGAALSHVLLRAGYAVRLIDSDQEALVPGLEQIGSALEDASAAGQISIAQREDCWERLQPGLVADPGSPVDLVFVTGAYARPKAPPIALPAGSFTPVVTMGRVGAGGAQALGLVLAPAIEEGRLAELLVTEQSAAGAIGTTLAVLKKLQRITVQARGTGICAGLAAAFADALGALEARHGAGPVMELLQRWGMDAPDGAAAQMPKPGTDAFAGLAAPLLGALANAGFRILGEGMALRPSDIDVAMVLGLNFPRHMGGPMLWAQQRGLLLLRRDLQLLAEHDPAIWTPAPLLEDLIRDGIDLKALNED